jgi:hypothetical protein
VHPNPIDWTRTSRTWVEHIEGLPAETPEQAVMNVSAYNGKLQTVLDKDNLDGQDLATTQVSTRAIAADRIAALMRAFTENPDCLSPTKWPTHLNQGDEEVADDYRPGRGSNSSACCGPGSAVRGGRGEVWSAWSRALAYDAKDRGNAGRGF